MPYFVVQCVKEGKNVQYLLILSKSTWAVTAFQQTALIFIPGLFISILYFLFSCLSKRVLVISSISWPIHEFTSVVSNLF